MRLLSFIFIIFLSVPGWAQLNLEKTKQITVFPIRIQGEVKGELEKIADATWWDIREKLTESKRFVVASRNFMQAKDVYQPRDELQPADVLILGRVLESHAIITVFLVDKTLSMRVYETQSGLTLWREDVELHPAVAIGKQLGGAAIKLLQDFLSDVPYQGQVVMDNLIGRVVFQKNNAQYVKVDVGQTSQVIVGDSAEIIRIHVDKLKPIFMGGGTVEVIAEGKVVEVERGVATVQLQRIQSGLSLAIDDLVRIPDERRRMRELYGLHEDNDKNIDYASINRVNSLEAQKQSERKPLVTSLSWIGNLLLVLLVAF